MREPRSPFHCTESLRATFKQVVGELVTDEGLDDLANRLKNSSLPILCVGDTTTINLFQAGVIPDLAIVDFETRRGAIDDSDSLRLQKLFSTGVVKEVRNPQEWVTTELWDTIRDFFSKYYNKFKIGRPERKGIIPLFIRIIGEEDLAALPCVYFAKQGGHILYGLPDEGLIHIQVDETHRTIVRDALIEMEA